MLLVCKALPVIEVRYFNCSFVDSFAVSSDLYLLLVVTFIVTVCLSYIALFVTVILHQANKTIG